MQISTETAAAVERDQEAFRNSGQSLLGRGASGLTQPLGRALGRALPSAYVAEGLRRIDDLSARIDFEAPAHELSDLGACRKAAERIERWAKGANAASGGTAGLAGAVTMTADIPATLAVAMRNIRETGRAYGYEGAGEDERLFRLRILELAALDDDRTRRARIAALEAAIAHGGDLQDKGNETAPLIDQAVERIARALAFSFLRTRLGAGLPVVGAVVGAAVNASFQGDVARAARFAFQARRLAAGRAASMV